MRLDDDLVLEPDLVFLRKDRMGIVNADGRIHGPPDLVVEVLSPSNRAYDRDLKRRRYLAKGVPELWIVDAEAHRIEVWRAGATEPFLPEGVLTWTVGSVSRELSLVEIFATSV